ncbi:MAG: ribosome maturation factor RimM [Anaerolineae bacterium]|nr:ribosome maturation factor RimM [Anaerolineae bacterium]
MRHLRSTHSAQNENLKGSPQVGEPLFLAVGKLRRPHGIHGEIIMEILTDFPERLGKGKTLYVGEEHESLKLAGARGHDQALLLTFEGFDSPESIGRLRNQIVYVSAKNLPELPEGRYYIHQIINMTVKDEDGQILGTVADVLQTGANDVYVVKTPQGGELLLPVIESVIVEIDPEKKEIKARPPSWL